MDAPTNNKNLKLPSLGSNDAECLNFKFTNEILTVPNSASTPQLGHKKLANPYPKKTIWLEDKNEFNYGGTTNFQSATDSNFEEIGSTKLQNLSEPAATSKANLEMEAPAEVASVGYS